MSWLNVGCPWGPPGSLTVPSAQPVRNRLLPAQSREHLCLTVCTGHSSCSSVFGSTRQIFPWWHLDADISQLIAALSGLNKDLGNGWRKSDVSKAFFNSHSVNYKSRTLFSNYSTTHNTNVVIKFQMCVDAGTHTQHLHTHTHRGIKVPTHLSYMQSVCLEIYLVKLSLLKV